MFLVIMLTIVIVILVILSEKPEYFGEVFSRIASFFNSWNKNNVKDDKKYNDLCAIEDIEEKECSKLFEWGLKKESVRNIAVTGPYGSGKSSFLKSFEKSHTKYNYLNISLASFNDNIEKGKEKLVEENILQQIIYKESANKFPNSRIKRIKELSFLRFFSNFCWVIIWVSSFYLKFGKPIWWNKIINLNDFKEFENFQSFILICGIFYFAYSLARNFGINKIVIKALDNEIELGKSRETSIFYKHLDEIIYFFKKTKYDVVFFEDIDRFESINVELFTKLRELNGLINDSSDIGRNIKFVYAIKDDLFESGIEIKENEEVVNKKRKDSHKLRTKFFDLIVPIIPVINYSNSKEILREKLWNNYLKEKYEIEIRELEEKKIKNESETEEEELENLIKKISIVKSEGDRFQDWIKKFTFYIDDMRVINNIVNEFIVYRNNINDLDRKGEKLSDWKLLGYIVYKNLYPEDFSKLHKREGRVYEIINGKIKKIEEITREEQLKLEELKKEKVRISDEPFDDIIALRTKLLNKIIGEGKPTGLDSQPILEYINNEDVFLKLRNRIYYSNRSTAPLSDVEKELGFTYEARKRLIEDKNNNKISIIQNEIDELEKKIREIKNYSIRELCKVYSVDKILENIFNNDPFLIFLFKEGVLDEKEYHTYTSYFYEGDLSSNDRDFILAFRNGKNDLQDISIDNPKAVMEELLEEEFLDSNVLNNDLIEFIFRNKENEEIKNKFNKFFEGSTKHTKENDYVKRIEKFLDVKGSLFVKEFMEFIPNLYDILDYYDSVENESYQDDLIKDIIEVCDNEIIENQNKNNRLSDYLYSNDLIEIFEDILDENDDNEKYVKFLEDKFTELLPRLCNKKLDKINATRDSKVFNYFYDNCLYEINLGNIMNILEIKCNLSDEEKAVIEIKPYRLIANIKDELKELKEYIDNNIQEFVNNVILIEDSKVLESEETLVEFYMLPDEKLGLEVKKNLIISQNVNIKNIKTVDKGLWSTLLKYNKVIATWENVLDYFESVNGNLDNLLVGFLNKIENYKVLCETEIASASNDDERISSKLRLSRRIIVDERIDTCSFEYLVKSIYFIDDFEIKGITLEKLKLIIGNRQMCLNEDTLIGLKEAFPEMVFPLIDSKIEVFMKTDETYEDILDDDDFLEIFKKYTTEEFRINFIEKFSISEIFEEHELMKEIREFLKSFIGFEKLTDLKIKELNSCKVLPVNDTIIERLKKIDKEENIKEEFDYFITKNIKKVIANIETLNFIEADYILILDKVSSDVSMLENYLNYLGNLVINDELVEKIITAVLSINQELKVNKDVVKRILSKDESTERKSKLIERQLSTFQENEILDIFSVSIDYLDNSLIKKFLDLLGGDFKLMIETSPIYLDKNEVNMEILKRLKKKSIVSSFTETENNTIKVNMKKKLEWT